MDAWQRQAKKPEKLAPAAEVARHLGWNDLVADTFPSERKFNIWYFLRSSLMVITETSASRSPKSLDGDRGSGGDGDLWLLVVF